MQSLQNNHIAFCFFVFFVFFKFSLIYQPLQFIYKKGSFLCLFIRLSALSHVSQSVCQSALKISICPDVCLSNVWLSIKVFISLTLTVLSNATNLVDYEKNQK